MKNRTWLILGVCALSILVTLTGAIPSWLAFFNARLPGWQTTVIYINLLIILAYLATSDHLSKNDMSETLAEWHKTLLGTNLTRVLHEDEFYMEFDLKLERAQHNVDICHLGKIAPSRRKGSAEKEYYDGFVRAVKGSPAQFRRIERVTPEKVEWVGRLIDGLKGAKNFSLACLIDADMASEQILPVSVQRIDSDEAYLVALGEHNSTTGYRDIYLRSREVNTLIGKYFGERLWKKCRVVIDRGTFFPAEWAAVQDAIKKLQA